MAEVLDFDDGGIVPLLPRADEEWLRDDTATEGEEGSDEEPVDDARLGMAPAATRGEEEPAAEGEVQEGGEEEPAGDDDVIAAVDAADVALAVPLADAAGEAVPAAAHGYFSISPLGYVKCSLPNFDPDKVIGHIGHTRDGASIFANCRLHPKCTVTCGVRRHDVSREYMAAWLCMGEPVDKALPRAEREAAGRHHVALWKRPY